MTHWKRYSLPFGQYSKPIDSILCGITLATRVHTKRGARLNYIVKFSPIEFRSIVLQPLYMASFISTDTLWIHALWIGTFPMPNKHWMAYICILTYHTPNEFKWVFYCYIILQISLAVISYFALKRRTRYIVHQIKRCILIHTRRGWDRVCVGSFNYEVSRLLLTSLFVMFRYVWDVVTYAALGIGFCWECK